MMFHPYLRAALLVLVAVCLPSFVPSAEAAEPSAARALLDEVGKASKHPEREGLRDAMERLPATYAASENPRERKQLLAAIGKVLKDKRAGAARSAAARALAKLDDTAAAWPTLAKALPKTSAKDTDPFQLEALRSVGSLAPEPAITVLLKLATKAKSPLVAREAILALGSYGTSKKRAAVLKTLLESAVRLHASAEANAKRRKPKGGAWAEPWKVLGDAYVTSLNRLTGQQHPDAAAWFEAYDKHKRDLDALFAAAPAAPEKATKRAD